MSLSYMCLKIWRQPYLNHILWAVSSHYLVNFFGLTLLNQRFTGIGSSISVVFSKISQHESHPRGADFSFKIRMAFFMYNFKPMLFVGALGGSVADVDTDLSLLEALLATFFKDGDQQPIDESFAAVLGQSCHAVDDPGTFRILGSYPPSPAAGMPSASAIK
jgi:hypothetical protein